MFKLLLPAPLLWALGGVFVLLVLASCHIRVLEARKPEKTGWNRNCAHQDLVVDCRLFLADLARQRPAGTRWYLH
jgi:hypothetical protein